MNLFLALAGIFHLSIARREIWSLVPDRVQVDRDTEAVWLTACSFGHYRWRKRRGQRWFKTTFSVASAAQVMTMIFSTCPIANTLDVFCFVASACSPRIFCTLISEKNATSYADIFLVQIPNTFCFIENEKYRYRNVMMLDSKSTLRIK
ncbi:hypothetical protein CGQ24_04690 [Arthrobacter sp. 7749]|nr:hypothetical protein CGQ24_04690 [Arthrobacter sp. 7749]